jgi:uncharacterized protein with ParB-like and HNH nuclease domain
MNSEQDVSVDNDENGIEEVDDILSIPRYIISSYGADFDVEGLIKRLDRGDIFVPDFQRNYVWRPDQASQFVESILLGLPIPGIILALDDDATEENKRKMYIVDGLQRLTTLRSFIKGEFPNGKEFRLIKVQESFLDKKFVDLSSGDQRTINDYFVHATIIRQEKPDKDKSGIYFVFRRLNTNGTPLTPQEIRSAIYQGKFDQLLQTLSESNIWDEIYRSQTKALRKAKEELILRFFALYFNLDEYKKPMEMFLNEFMSRNRDLQIHSEDQLTSLFNSAIVTIYMTNKRNSFRLLKRRSAFNNAIFDSVMIGIARRLEKGAIQNVLQLSDQYEKLLSDEEFISYVTGPTTDEENVKARIGRAVEFFAVVE